MSPAAPLVDSRRGPRHGTGRRGRLAPDRLEDRLAPPGRNGITRRRAPRPSASPVLAGGGMESVTPDSGETQRLLDQLRGGDGRAFEQLFARHRPYLRRLVALRLDNRLRPRLDPSDVVQDTQLEALRRMPDYLERRPMPFRLWLRKTAQERLAMLARKHLGAARRTV